MNKRLKQLFSALAPCKKFADVGCDHGYVAHMMIEEGKAERVVISDISAPSLKKAEELLSAYMGDRVTSVVCDGLSGVDTDCDQVLIAGMGGEEIISILSSSPFLPERLVVQPMKNVDKVRKRLLSLGYRIVKDYIFRDVKFYNLIVCERGEDSYSEEEIFFGRDNLLRPSADFISYARSEINKYEDILQKGELPPSVRAQVEQLIEKYRGVIK